MSSVFKELYLDHIVKFISMVLPVSSLRMMFSGERVNVLNSHSYGWMRLALSLV